MNSNRFAPRTTSWPIPTPGLSIDQTLILTMYHLTSSIRFWIRYGPKSLAGNLDWKVNGIREIRICFWMKVKTTSTNNWKFQIWTYRNWQTYVFMVPRSFSTALLKTHRIYRLLIIGPYLWSRITGVWYSTLLNHINIKIAKYHSHSPKSKFGMIKPKIEIINILTKREK